LWSTLYLSDERHRANPTPTADSCCCNFLVPLTAALPLCDRFAHA
jgi:hypothetical protein